MAALKNADEAVALVLHKAMEAAQQGTFAVGGAIIENATGRVLQAMHNNVLRTLANGQVMTWDPTAHGERQLVYWYEENRKRLGLPAPSELTVVTSLDPCVMCTGALLSLGFNVAVAAIDDYAGINHDEKFEFLGVPPSLRETAKQKFGYYAAGESQIDPRMYVREYVGGEHVAFRETATSAVHFMGCGTLFADSSNVVRAVSSDQDGLAPGNGLEDPAQLPDDSPIKVAFRKLYPQAFQLTVEDPRFPSVEILEELDRVAKASPHGSGNAVALLDPFGNLVLCLGGREQLSPVYVPFMEVTQAYANTRFELANEESTRELARKHLTVPKYGTFVFQHAPNPRSPEGLMTLGAYGSSMEGPIPRPFPANLQYVHGPLEGSVSELAHLIVDLPPLYNDLVHVGIGRTPNAGASPAEPVLDLVPSGMRRTVAPRPQVRRHESVYRCRQH